MSSKNSDRWAHFRALMLRDLCLLLNCPPDSLPAVFKLTVPAPLKVGILEDVQARYPEADTLKLKRWFKSWVSRFEYLERVGKNGQRHRIDLDGCRAGPITDQEKIYSQLLVSAAVSLADRKQRHPSTFNMIFEGNE